jgi:hypothetical protein
VLPPPPSLHCLFCYLFELPEGLALVLKADGETAGLKKEQRAKKSSRRESNQQIICSGAARRFKMMNDSGMNNEGGSSGYRPQDQEAQDFRSPLMASVVVSNDSDSGNGSSQPQSNRNYDIPSSHGNVSKIDQIVRKNSGLAININVPSANGGMNHNNKGRPTNSGMRPQPVTAQVPQRSPYPNQALGSPDSSNQPGSRQNLGMYRFILLLVVVGAAELYVSHFMYTFHHSYSAHHGDDAQSFAEGEGPTLFHEVGGHVKNHLDNFAKGRGGGATSSKRPQEQASIATSVTDSNNHEKEQHKLVEMLAKAGVQATPETIAKFPPYEDIMKLYGSEPIIHGLDTCETYRNLVPAQNRSIGPAGMFNSGTNFLYSLLMNNCEFPDNVIRGTRTDIIWQIAWGKHTPASWRWRNFPKHWKDINHDHVLPIVVIKDPYTWMGSMCRSSYSANWPHHEEHCPNLIKTELDKHRHKDTPMGQNIPVSVRYNKTHVTQHTNLAGLWNDWYGAYFNTTEYPRLIVRYEDLLFRPESTIDQVCQCAGGRLKHPHTQFVYTQKSAKGTTGPHSGASDLSGALMRYSSSSERIKNISIPDLEVASQQLHPDMMQTFAYPIASAQQ